MAEVKTTAEQFGFIPDVDESTKFDFQVEPEVEVGEEFGFVPDEQEPVEPENVKYKVDKSFNVAEDSKFDQVQFSADVLEMPEPISLAGEDPSMPPEGEFFEDPIGFTEALINKATGRPQELLPFVGPLFSTQRMGRLVTAATRVRNNPEPPKRNVLIDETDSAFADRQIEWMKDRYIVAEWVEELNERQERGVSVGGQIAEGILELPAFIVEFVTTAGVYEGAKQGTKVAIAKVLKRSGEKVSKEFAEKVAQNTGIKLATKLAGAVVGTAARTGIQATRVAKSSLEKLMPGVQITGKGEVLLQESGETPFSAFAKGFGDVFIENISEISGPVITKAGQKVLSKFPFLGKLDDAIKTIWLSKNPNKTAVDFVKEIGTKAGYNGFIEELGEEQIGKALRAATGVETFGAVQTGDELSDLVARMVAAVPDGEELLVEAGILAPLTAIGVAGKAVSARAGLETEGLAAEEEVAVEPIDRTSETALGEIQSRVAVAENLPKEAKAKLEAESVSKVKERISFKKPKVPVVDKLKDIALKTDKAFRDEFAVLRKAVKAVDPEGKLPPADNPVELAVAFTQKSSAKTRGFVIEATTDLAGNRKSKGMKQIFKPIVADGGKKNVEDFVTYLVAARDIQLQKQNKETGIDPVASRLAFDSLDSPAFAQAAREITEWNQKGIDLLVESGRITREAGDIIKASNPIYAPFFREFGEKEVTGKGKKGGKFAPKRLKGSERKIVDPIEGMIQQMDAIINSAQRASIERSIANLALENPDALEEFITPIKAPTAPVELSIDEVKSQLEEVGVSFNEVPEKDLKELLTIFRPVKGQKPGVISLKVDGKDKHFQVQQDLLDVLEGTDNYKLGPFWDFVVGKPTRLLKLGATGLSPSFGLIRNPIRDLQTFTVTSEFAKGGPLSAVGGILKDVKTKTAGIAENFGFEGIEADSDVQRFSALGGEMSGFISQDRAGTKHLQHEMLASNGIRYTINTFKDPIDAMRSLIGVTEVGSRVGEFSAALKEGERLYGKGSLSASVFALNAAQDVTTNFTRHGQIGKQINQVIPFFNAAIQGPDKLVRSFRKNPKKATAAAISALTVPAVFFWWRNKDKEWYKNMTAHEKANYLHFEHPDKEDVVFRFPTPFELGHVFQAMPVAFLDAIYRKNPQEIPNILEATLNTSNPLDWPSLIGPIIDIKANEDFAGRPIVSRANEGKLPKDQFGPHTTELMKAIGKAINMSPSKLEHMTNSYTGGIYNKVARMLKNNEVEKQAADLPVVGTLFARDPFAPRRQVEEFYQERSLLNQKFNSKDIAIDESIRRIVMNNMASVLTVHFDLLRDAKTTEKRKEIWESIGDIVGFVREDGENE